MELSDIFQVLSRMDDPTMIRRFLEDLCSPGELRSLQERWRVAQIVDKRMPYRQIQALTGVSTATITRVARHVSQGAGGYRYALDQQRESDALNSSDQNTLIPSP